MANPDPPSVPNILDRGPVVPKPILLLRSAIE
jgi:hypothetical protein